MTWVMNGEPLVPESNGYYLIGDVQYPPEWPFDELGAVWVPAPVDLRAAAMEALRVSDIRVIRSFEDGVPVPPEWVAYRVALRAIVNGAEGPLPDIP